MKKIISILLILLLCLSFNICANADGEANSEVITMPEIKPEEIIKPDMTVHVWIDDYGPVVDGGTIITIYSETTNSEYYDEIIYQWKGSNDGGNSWEEIPGANSSTYSVTMIEFNYYKLYKLTIYYR